MYIFSHLMFPEVDFTEQSDCFLHLCVAYICSYISAFSGGHILSQCMGDWKLLISSTPRRGTLKASDSQLWALFASEDRYKSRDYKNTLPGIHIYLSSSAFYTHCTQLYLLAVLRERGESCVGATPSRWLLGCHRCRCGSWLR